MLELVISLITRYCEETGQTEKQAFKLFSKLHIFEIISDFYDLGYSENDIYSEIRKLV